MWNPLVWVGALVGGLQVWNQGRIAKSQETNALATLEREKIARSQLDLQHGQLQHQRASLEYQKEQAIATLQAKAAELELQAKSLETTVQENEKNRQLQRELKDLEIQAQKALQMDSFNFQITKAHIDHRLRMIEIEPQQEHSLLMQQKNHQNVLEQMREKRRQDNSPLRTLVSDLVEEWSRLDPNTITVIFSPPILNYEPWAVVANNTPKDFPRCEQPLEWALRNLINTYKAKGRSVHFKIGWTTRALRAEDALGSIYREASIMPTIVTETCVDEYNMYPLLGYWEKSFPIYTVLPVVDQPVPWSGQDGAGIVQFLSLLQAIHVGKLLDEHFLMHVPLAARKMPLLPQLLPGLLKGLDEENATAVIRGVVQYYEGLYDHLAEAEPTLIPLLRLDLALAFSTLPGQMGAREQLRASAIAWLALRDRTPQPDLWTAVMEMLGVPDREYVDKLNQCLRQLGEERQLSIEQACFQRGLRQLGDRQYQAAVDDFSQVIALNPHGFGAYWQRGLAYLGLEQETANQQALADFEQVLARNPEQAEVYRWRGEAHYRLGCHEQALADLREAANRGVAGAEERWQVVQGVWQEAQRRQQEAAERRQREEADRQRKMNDFYNSGVFHLQRGDYAQAIADFREAERYGHRKAREKWQEAERQQQEAERRRALIFKLPNDGGDLEFVEIKAGTLNLGGNEIQLAAFRMSKYPITQRQYLAIMSNNPSHFTGDLDRPVERVYWKDAVAFCEALSKEPVMAGQTVRLPSEAQWEYACRAGTTTKFWFGDNNSELGKHAWYDGNSGNRTHSVYEKAAEHENPWGLVDMHGNVWEWCQDNWTSNTNELPKDGTPLLKGGDSSRHAVRGGSWLNYADSCASGSRNYWNAGSRDDYLGFRIVLLA